MLIIEFWTKILFVYDYHTNKSLISNNHQNIKLISNFNDLNYNMKIVMYLHFN